MTDELYQVPLAEFTPTRDALAARMKAAGDAKAAAEIKGAKKPSVPAWAVNQVVWHASKDWQRLQAASEGLRQKHHEGAPAEELRRASAEQREALQACEARATEFLVKHGHAASPAVLTKVQHTLLALAYGVAGVTAGRLEQELPAPGFEVLSGLSVAPARRDPAPSKGRPESDAKERAQRRAARTAAEARRAESRKALEKARQKLSADAERLQKLEKQIAEARDTVTAAREQVEAAEKEHQAAEAALEELGDDAD